MKKSFHEDHGYSIAKYLPVLFHGNGLGAGSDPPIWWITNEPDSGFNHVADYRRTVSCTSPRDGTHVYMD
jgi:hypothetical protein